MRDSLTVTLNANGYTWEFIVHVALSGHVSYPRELGGPTQDDADAALDAWLRDSGRADEVCERFDEAVSLNVRSLSDKRNRGGRGDG